MHLFLTISKKVFSPLMSSLNSHLCFGTRINRDSLEDCDPSAQLWTQSMIGKNSLSSLRRCLNQITRKPQKRSDYMNTQTKSPLMIRRFSPSLVTCIGNLARTFQKL